MIITIDGPIASGKSVVARALADRLGFHYLPTGWFYRSVSYLLVTRCGYTLERLSRPDESDVAFCLDPKHLHYQYSSVTGGKVLFMGEDITPFLKDYTVDQSVCLISPVIMVRDLVSATQHRFAREFKNCVIEGRDSGSVVFADADCKFYITASLTVRAQRWQKDQLRRGHDFTLEQAQEQITMRDTRDKERDYCPLVIPEGAYVIEGSNLTVDQTVTAMLLILDTEKKN